MFGSPLNFLVTGVEAALIEIRIGFSVVPGFVGGDILNGMDAAFVDANARNTAPGYTFVLETYPYPHCDLSNPASPVCDLSPAKALDGLSDFLGNMSKFHAVFSPPIAFSAIAVARARELGIPLIDPVTILPEDFVEPNFFHITHLVETEIATLIRYMFSSFSCARSGVFYDREMPGVDSHRAFIREAFVSAGYPPPAELEVSLATPANAIRSFYFGDDDSSRRCFVALCGGQIALHTAFSYASDPRMLMGVRKLFILQYTSRTIPASYYQSGDPAELFLLFLVLSDLSMVNNYPSMWNAPSGLIQHFGQAWDLLYNVSAVARDRQVTVMSYALHTFLTVSWLLAIFSNAARFDLSDPETAWGHFINTAYDGGDVLIGDYQFSRPIRRCLPKPMLASSCHCTVVSRFSYINSYDMQTLQTVAVAENAHEGQVGSTAIYFDPSRCSLPITADTFPVRMLVATTPVTANAPILSGPGQLSRSELYFSYVRQHNQRLANSSNTGSSRRRVVSQQFPAEIVSATVPVRDAYLDTLARTYEPFVILSSDAEVWGQRFLTFDANHSHFPLADPPLAVRAVGGWNEKVILFMPTFADYAHAMASYYVSANGAASPYTSLHVFAAGIDEAALMVKSLNTFQVRIGLRDVFISNDATVLNRRILATVGQLPSSARPFIFVGIQSTDNAPLADELVSHGIAAAQSSQLPEVTYALVTSDATLDTLVSATAASLPADGNVHVLFASVFSEWWIAGPIRQAMATIASNDTLQIIGDSVSYYMPTLGYSVADQLSSMRVAPSTTAAEVLYTARSASFADVPLGPFSNDTCPPAVIESNEVDRSCQCNKAFRLFRVHSVDDWRARRPSLTTGRYSYQMATCGVKYLPLVEAASDSTITRIAIGVGVGGGLVLLGLVLAILFVMLFGGRNNRNAPKDATKAFAMAFTDIQSSTTLWARCPSIMSDAVEHHGVVLRRLLRRYNGYEVKTIGDSFMVAFSEVEDAVAFGIGVQEELHRDTWWPADLDQHYQEMLEGDGGHGLHDTDDVPEELTSMGASRKAELTSVVMKGNETDADADPTVKQSPPHDASDAVIVSALAIEEEGGAPLNAPRDPTEYRRLWNGLRVRVGIHYGFGKIQKDEVTHGYDYYGTIVNTAARVEGVGHGGQTLVTDAVMKYLGEDYITHHKWSCQSLGSQLLRGLDERVELIQLLPSSLADRRFPPLRLDVEKDVAEVGGDANADSDDGRAPSQHKLEAMALTMCADTFRSNRAAKRRAAAADGTYSEAGTNASHTSFVANPTARANVADLMHQYQFLSSLLATSTDAWRRDALKNFAERWRVTGFNKKRASAAHNSNVLMQVALKAMLAQRAAAAANDLTAVKTVPTDDRQSHAQAFANKPGARATPQSFNLQAHDAAFRPLSPAPGAQQNPHAPLTALVSFEASSSMNHPSSVI